MDVPLVFDRIQVRRQRDRAAATLAGHDFLFAEAAARLADRLLDTLREFPLALDLGCHTGQLGRALAGTGRVGTLVACDLSPRMAAAAGPLALAADEEALPFAEASFDLVLSCLSLHWVNDLPGALVQIRRVLKPEGLLLAAMLGGETLGELRRALIEAEVAESGGASPRVSPFVDLRDAAGLLQRAGFALPVADLDVIDVTYADPLRLYADLRGMGEANALAARRRGFTRRATLVGALARYAGDHPGAPIPVQFQVVGLTGWRSSS